MRRALPIVFALALGGMPSGSEEVQAKVPANPPRIDYMLQCQGCHLADGGGSPKDGVPDLRGSVARFLHVPGGREYLMRVPGASGSPLSDGELAAVLNWVVQTYGPAEAARRASPFSAAEVARHRRPPLAEVYRARQKLIEAMDGAPASR